jgi:hypothetical protein
VTKLSTDTATIFVAVFVSGAVSLLAILLIFKLVKFINSSNHH